MSLDPAFERLLPLIEADLQTALAPAHPALEPYYGMMRYHLGWLDEQFQPQPANSGKRLRPLLCLLSSEALGGDVQQALPAASALELVHNFSLVHDDIQDNSRFRRGRRAVWDVWGAAQGINVGDGLFVLARLAVHRLAERGVPLPRQQAATVALDQACLALCEGQFLDLTFEDRLDVDLEQYLWMIRHKTAALLAASTQIGALLATDDEGAVERFHRFGENLGLAFQIQDDILGVWGDERLTGKSVASDIQTKKKALPAVYALNQSHDREAAQALAALYSREGPLDAQATRQALSIVDRVGAREYAEEMATRYYQQALESLAPIKPQAKPQAIALAELRRMAASLLGRQT